jgi:hypothetical protein
MAILTDDATRERFINTYTQIIRDRYNELQEKRDRLNKYRRQRINEPAEKVKNRPYPNASNVEVPMTSSISQTMYGNLKNTFLMRDPFWSVRPIQRNNKELAAQAKVLSKFYDIISKSPTDLNLRAQNNVIFYEGGTLGTAFVKTIWYEDEWKYKRTDTNGNVAEVIVKTHNGPSMIPIMEEDVIYPDGCEDPERAPWIATISHLYPHELRHREQMGIYENIEVILGEDVDEVTVSPDLMDENRASEDDRQGRSGGVAGTVPIVEIYAFFDADNDKQLEDIVVTMHLESGTVLRAEYNELGMRPVDRGVYMHIPYSMTGRGTCQMTEGMQDEITTIHNMSIDADKLAISTPCKYRKDRGIQPNMTMYPGKMIPVEEMDDLIPMSLGNVNLASINREGQSYQYAARNSGISDTMAGFADTTLKSRDTLGGQTLRYQQGMGMFNAIVEGFMDFFSRVGMKIFYLLVNNRDKVIEKEKTLGRMSDSDIAILDAALNIDVTEIPMRMAFSVRTRDLEDTKDVYRQNLMMLFQIQNNYFQSNAPVIMQLYGPQGAQMPQEIRDFFYQQFQTTTNVLRQMAEMMNIDNVDDVTLDIDEYDKKELQLKQQKAMMMLMQQMQGMAPMMQQQRQLSRVPDDTQAMQSSPQEAAARQTNSASGMEENVEGGEVNDFRRNTEE